jgi:hypothetical protein
MSCVGILSSRRTLGQRVRGEIFVRFQFASSHLTVLNGRCIKLSDWFVKCVGVNVLIGLLAVEVGDDGLPTAPI